MANETTTLTVTPRETEGSRANRRLRRSGRVPAVVYGGGDDSVAVSIDARELRHALHASGAVIELQIDGSATPVVLKDTQMHPVRGETWHVDFLRVRMDVAIESTVTLELVGVEDAPGHTEGGVLEQQLRELTIEALPGDIPESVTHDVSALNLGDTVHVSDLTAPNGVTILDDAEIVIASLQLPKLEVEEPEVETETEVVGEGEEAPEGEAAEGGEGEDAPADDGGSERLRRVAPHEAAPPVGAGRLARRRPGQPRHALRGHAAQRRLRGRQRARAPLGPAVGEEEVQRARHRGQDRGLAAPASPSSCPRPT